MGYVRCRGAGRPAASPRRRHAVEHEHPGLPARRPDPPCEIVPAEGLPRHDLRQDPLVRALAAQAVEFAPRAVRDRHAGGARERLDLGRPSVLPALLQVKPAHPAGIVGQQRPDGVQPEHRDHAHRRARPPFERRG